jgi:peptide/nickel transport system substrate-binding protein
VGRTRPSSLRRDVVFHDGTRFDADAVVFSFDRQRDPHHPYHHPDFGYWESTFRNIERVEKLENAWSSALAMLTAISSCTAKMSSRPRS